MKKLVLVLIYALIILSIQCTESSRSSVPLCIGRLKGKVVSQGPACAGVAIQILSGSFDPHRVDTLWFDAYVDNPTTYHNVFKTYPYCSAENEDGQLLLDVIETGTEFYFIFENNENSPECGIGDHTICKPIVSLPENANRILIVHEECNDQITIY